MGELLVPSITLTEVFRIILRQRGEEAALRAIAHMEQGPALPGAYMVSYCKNSHTKEI